jgi:DNA primase
MARPLLALIPDGVFKEMMFEALAKIAQSTPHVVNGKKASRMDWHRAPRTFSPPPPSQGPVQPVIPTAYIISALLIRYPTFHSVVKEKIATLPELSVPGMALLRSLLSHLEADPALTSLEIYQRLQEAGLPLNHVKNCDNKLALIPAEGVEPELLGAIARLVTQGKQQLAEKLLKKSKTTDLTTEEKHLLIEILQARETN